MRVALNGLFLQYPATGTGQYLRELVRAMRAVSPQDEFDLIAPFPDTTAPAPVWVASPRSQRENLAKLEFEQWSFSRALDRLHPDAAHVPHFGSPLVPFFPTVVTIHDLIPVVLPAYRGPPRVRLYTRLAMLGARRAQAILADSFASARDIHKRLGIPEAKIHVIHLAANARYRPPSADEIARVRAKYGLPDRFVLYLGGFDVRKNVAQTLRAFSTGAGADWQLVLAGKLPDEDTAFFPDPRRMAAQSGIADRIKYAGFVAEEDKPALYGAARVFLYPSLYEGFGLPPLEAMASGTPVIVSNTSSLPEVVGTAGIQLPPDDAPGWGEALRELLADDGRWRARRALGLGKASEFSWERAAQETLAVYRSVV